MTAIHLSLISHTNVGKTTLARTLLRRDVGEVIDAAHVTELASEYTLIETTQGDALRLWDTPGFGDSARLLKRLRRDDSALGWFLTQVWDRCTDRPFFSSQQALRNIRDSADVVLYLVNSAEDPASAGYLDAEMQIVGWLAKPVLVLLNQLGPPRAPQQERAEVERWASFLRRYPCVRDTLAFDAFARCWVPPALCELRLERFRALPGNPILASLRFGDLHSFQFFVRNLKTGICGGHARINRGLQQHFLQIGRLRSRARPARTCSGIPSIGQAPPSWQSRACAAFGDRVQGASKSCPTRNA